MIALAAGKSGILASPRQPPRRVLFVATSMPIGGAETLLANLIRGFDRSRYAPELATLRTPGTLAEELSDEYPVHRCAQEDGAGALAGARIGRLIRSRRPEAVITVGAGAAMLYGQLAARLSGTPVALSLLRPRDGRNLGPFNRWASRFVDALATFDMSQTQSLIETRQVDAGKINTLRGGVDVGQFRPALGTAARQELGIPSDAPVVGVVGSLRAAKNHALFLAGARQILHRFPQTQFLIVGAGEKREALQQLASQLRISPAVHFLGARRDVAELLPAMDVLTLTSLHETCPVAALEAQACEVPVVAADVGTVAAAVQDGRTGLLFPTGDLQAYASATARLLDDAALRRRLGKAGRRFVVQQASHEATARAAEQLLDKLLANKSQTRETSVRATVGRQLNGATP